MNTTKQSKMSQRKFKFPSFRKSKRKSKDYLSPEKSPNRKSSPLTVRASTPPAKGQELEKEQDTSDPSLQYKDLEAYFGPLYPELICYGCTKMYTNPFLLPCNDSVCETCLHKMKSEMKKDKRGQFSVKCPICKSEFHFESMREIKFPENYLLQIIVKEQKRKISANLLSPSGKEMQPEEIKIFCQLCDVKFPRSSIRRCITCSLNFCEKCLKDIHGNKAFLSHTLSDSTFVTDTRIKCYLHPENEIILYCSTDHTLLCEECYNASHGQHITRSVQDAFQTETKEVLGMSSNFHKAVESCERTIMKLNLLKKELDETESEIDQSLFKEFLTLHEEIQLQHTYIGERLKSEKLKKKLHIDNFVDSASKSVYKMEGLDHFIAEALKQVNPAVFLQMASPIKARIKKSMCDIVEPSSTLTVNPLKNFQFDFAYIRSQITNLHLNILQPEPIVFHAEEERAPENKATSLPESIVGPNTEKDTLGSTSIPHTEKDILTEIDNPAPEENANNHHFELECPIINCSESSSTSEACPPESKINCVKEQNLERAEEDECDGHSVGPVEIKAPLTYKSKVSFLPCKPDCQQDSIIECCSSADSNSSGSTPSDVNNVCCKEDLNNECTQDMNNGCAHDTNNGCMQKDMAARARRRNAFLAFRLAGDVKVDTCPKSPPSGFCATYVEPETVNDHNSCNLDICSSSSEDTPVPSPLPGKPVIYEHTADANSAKIFWAPLTENKVVRYYEVQLQEIMCVNNVQSFPRDQSGLFSGIKQETFKATELNANSEYLFRVRAVNNIGRGEWSDPYKLSTLSSTAFWNKKRQTTPSRSYCSIRTNVHRQWAPPEI
ncbi:tripartite motif-containing protein 42-like isoform X2 [Ambystoma mexicanum]|uniref:tripartite motif-containing protein 42-like isoform X2 n=1 Tax=Ambystoma mexicanum TaxID=8296 RepID=UPI0037E7D2C3